jgi:hypothetical protein
VDIEVEVKPSYEIDQKTREASGGDETVAACQ